MAFVLGGAFSLQFGAAVAVILLGRVGPLGAVTLRTVLATILLLGVLRPRISGRSWHDLILAASFGLTLGGMNLCFYEAAARLPLGAAVTFEFLGPLTLAIVTSRRGRDLAWVACAGAGVWLLSGAGLRQLEAVGLDMVGIAFALGAGTLWAGYILLGSRTSRRFVRADGLALGMAAASVVLLPAGGVTAGTQLLQPWALGLGCTVAVASSVLPYTLEMSALRRIPARTFGVLMSLAPAVAALAGYLVLDQVLTRVQLLAIGLVIVASAGATHPAARYPS